MNKTQILLKRCNKLPVGKGSKGNFGPAFLAQLAHLGYQVDRPDLINNSMAGDALNIFRTLSEIRGNDVEYVPLFPDFPETIPELTEEQLQQIKQNKGINPLVTSDYLRGQASSIPQDPEKYEEGVEDQKSRESDTHSELVTLEVISEDQAEEELVNWFRSNLYAKSSIKQTLEPDMRWVLANLQPEFSISKVEFKENLKFIFVYAWSVLQGQQQKEVLQATCKSPTDILRMFASVTGTDVSLSEPIRFPSFSRPQRKLVLDLLDGYNNLAEDLDRYRGLWLAIDRVYLHPGDYKDEYPGVLEAFDLLRNDNVKSFLGYFDQHLKQGNEDELFNLMKSRPTMFARKLNQLLRSSKVASHRVLLEFSKISTQVPLKILITLHAYFRGINNAETRPIVNKNGFMYVMENDQDDLPGEMVLDILNTLAAAITSKTEHMKIIPDDVEKIWVDPKLERLLVPLQQRHASESMINVARGSRLPVDLSSGRVLRMFMWWKHATTDLDLSMMVLSEDLDLLRQVSFTNLKESGITHSGDLTSAPKGATEFIDVELDELLKENPNARYLVSSILRFGGSSFDEIPAHAGWMVRKKATKNSSGFDPKTVQNKFDLHRSGAYCLPLIYDIEKQEMVYLDLYIKGRRRLNMIENTETSTRNIVKGILEYQILKPNIKDLVQFHIQHSDAEVTEDIDEADFIFGSDQGDYKAFESEVILSKLI